MSPRSIYCGVIVFQLLFLGVGCTHVQLQRNTVHQSDSLSVIYQKQVLDNLAMFVNDPYAVPSFAVANQGTSTVADGGTATANPGAFRNRFWSFFSLSGSRTATEAWGLLPVSDPAKLKLMRCAYQHAVGLACEPCVDSCKLEKAWLGKTGNQKLVVFDVDAGVLKKDPDTRQPYVDQLTGASYVSLPAVSIKDSDGTTHFEPSVIYTDPRTNEPYDYDKDTGEVTIPQWDCNNPCAIHQQWFCHSNRWRDVPKECGTLYGYNKGTYVWVPCEYRHELAKLVFAILDYGVNSPSVKATKSVVVYLDADGEQTTKSDFTKQVTATVPIDATEAQIRLALGLSPLVEEDETALVESAKEADSIQKLSGDDLNKKMTEFYSKNAEAHQMLLAIPGDLKNAHQAIGETMKSEQQDEEKKKQALRAYSIELKEKIARKRRESISSMDKHDLTTIRPQPASAAPLNYLLFQQQLNNVMPGPVSK